MQRGIKRIMGKIKKRAGFTLIEVIVALGILMIVVLALVSSYYSYYNSVKDLRYKAIGQNLAQLQLEDARNLALTVLDHLCNGGQWPGPSATPYPIYPDDITDGDPNPNDDTVYDSGEFYGIIGSTDVGLYRLDGLNYICGSFSGDLPHSPNELILPPGVEVLVNKDVDGNFTDYSLVFYRHVFPNYGKEIIIKDLTPSEQTYNKIYNIEVRIYWKTNGTTKSTSVFGVRSNEKGT